MVLEVATLNVRAGQEAAFEAAFAEAKPIIVGMNGFISLKLQKGVEHPSRYLIDERPLADGCDVLCALGQERCATERSQRPGSRG